MPIPYNVARILPYFNRVVKAYDLIGELVDFKMSVRKSDVYSIVGTLIPPTDKDLNLFDEGEIAGGAMVLYVNSSVKLYVADAFENATEEFRQTIILFDGDEYRIKGYSNRAADGLHRKYTMVRYFGGRSV